jgi:mannose-1-phosphate guanylyltransferase / phosphomannomutase
MKAVFLDRDGVLNIEKNYLSKPGDLELFSFSAEAIRKINLSGYLAIVVTNQSAVARNLCTLDDVDRIHEKLIYELSKHNAHIDAIYFCPHYYEEGSSSVLPEFNIDCDCRKPKTGMFLKASVEFGIELDKSYMIGDTERDIVAGKNAGCVTIGVRTGYGLKDSAVRPDYMFDDLLAAADFIAQHPGD